MGEVQQYKILSIISHRDKKWKKTLTSLFPDPESTLHKMEGDRYGAFASFLLSMNERIFYIDQFSDISELIQLLKNTKADTVIFVLPQRSILLESIVNFQILQAEAEKEHKNMVIITKSKKCISMCQTVGVEYHTTLEQREHHVPQDAIVAKKNPEHERQHAIRRVPITVSEETKRNDEQVNWKDMLSRPSWQALSILMIFVVGLFFLLSVLAFPGATISIKPSRKAVQDIMNVRLLNFEKEENHSLSPLDRQRSIWGYPIEDIFSEQIQFQTATRIFQGENARGEITIYNTFGEPQRLRPTTRFQTDDGIVFRITDWIVVPESTRNENGEQVPGQRTVTVVADETDTLGRFVGERGNIPPMELFLPALDENARQNLWAESQLPFTGGFTDWIPEVAQVDIDAAQEKIISELSERAKKNIERSISEKNAREQTDLAMFDSDEFLEVEILDVSVEEDILGTSKENFSVSAEIKVRTWTYSQSELVDLAWSSLDSKTDPQMRLVRIREEYFRPEIRERNSGEYWIKLSLPVEGAEEFQIDPRSEAGILFANEVKREIVGMPISDAEAFLGNRDEVSTVDISVWPFWSRSIPSLPENITIELRNE